MSKQAYSHYLLEVKQEYTKQLSNMLVPVMYEGLMSIYNEAKKIKKDSPMKTFQILLSRIPQWNQNIINNEYQRIISKTQCDWINDLITAVFISHAKILSSIKTKKNNKTLNLKVPNGDYFIHKAYIECARQFWKIPYLFYDDVNTIEYQRNLREIEAIIEQSINETIRKLLPVKNILQQYIALDESDSEEEDTEEETVEEKPKTKKKEISENNEEEEDITSTITEKDKKKLEKSVKKEILKVNPSKDDDNHSIISISHEIPSIKRSISSKKVIVPNVVNDVELLEVEPKIDSIQIEEVPSKLRDEQQGGLYESLDENNSHELSMDELHPYPPKLNSQFEEEDELDVEPKERSLSVSKNSLIISKDDMNEFDRMSMNTKLDVTYKPEMKADSVVDIKPNEIKSIRIDIDEIPKVDESSIHELGGESNIENSISTTKPEIKTVKINMPNDYDRPTTASNKQNFARKRDMRKNYSFFD